ncbi:lachesin-like isoform X1 [Vespula squamosa]|uniref:Lachesin-like isoform X1 n=1 Tax=Vespula squamosa TaxID=30214 RepID=A0ABD2AAQ0_VESSQ
MKSDIYFGLSMTFMMKQTETYQPYYGLPCSINYVYSLPFHSLLRLWFRFCFYADTILTMPMQIWSQTLPKLEIHPEFLAPLENYTVTQGRDVSFTCVVNHLQSYKIAWIKSDSRAILAIHTHMVAHNPRLSVTHNGHNTWKLHVRNVQANDSGTYMCQINTNPMESQTGYMKVVIPPDIMDLDDSTDLLTAMENNDLRLRCRATGTPEPTVTWKREDGQEIVLRSELGVKRVKSYEGELLPLLGILRQEMGSYLCIATNGVPPTISKRYRVTVRFKPTIKIKDQLVVAPTYGNIILLCYIESSPRASSVWYKANGAKILTNDKYNVTETIINDYAYQSNLTIKYLNPNDFGSYICSAENLYGKIEGTIYLQELRVPKTTMSTIRNTEPDERPNLRKQIERKGGKKYSQALGRGVGSMNSTQRNVVSWTQITPISRRNNSNSLPSVVLTKNSKVSSSSSPSSSFSSSSSSPPPSSSSSSLTSASAPAHTTPTQQDVQSDATSTHDSQLVYQLHLMIIVLLFAMISFY